MKNKNKTSSNEFFKHFPKNDQTIILEDFNVDILEENNNAKILKKSY
jgi:hypothetical protein